MLLHQARLFFIALQFLTRLPAPRSVGFEPAWLRASARYFPLVGAVVGLAAAGALWVGRWLWTDAIGAGLSLAATALLTGAFHEDGLADTLDGLGGSHDKPRVLAIMKDSRIGTYGSLGLILVLGLKAAALAAWSAHAATGALVMVAWAHMASRLVPVWLMRVLPYAGDAEHAKAKPLATSVTRAELRLAAATVGGGAALALWLAPALAWPLAGAALAAALMGVFLRRRLAQRLGGFTGDTLGAAQQLSELAMLLAALAIALRVGAHA
jgi:adenosylcobinamide-GDP ribazoletransferase